MKQNYMLRPVGFDRWCGSFIVRVRAVPAQIPGGLAYQLLLMCEQGGYSLECCFATGSQAYKVHTLLLFRSLPDQSDRLVKSLELYAGQVLSTLIHAGFDAELVTEGSPDVLGDLVEGGDARTHGSLYWPQFAVHAESKGIVPGRMGITVDQLHIDKLLQVLCRFQNAALSVHLNLYALKKTDLEMIESNLNGFGAYQDQTAGDAKSRFTSLRALAGLQTYRMHWHASGSESYLLAMGLAMRENSMRSDPLPGALTERRGYISMGNEYMIQVEQLLADQMRIPSYLLCFSELADLQNTAKLIDMQGAAPACLSVNRRAISQQSLPDELRKPGGVMIGRVKGTGEEVRVQVNHLTRHGFVTGKPGSGKTTFGLHLLHEIDKAGVPFIVIEPQKTEYRSLIHSDLGKSGRLRVYTPGNAKVSPIYINPFVPPDGVTLEEFLPNLLSVFSMAISSTEFISSILGSVLRYAYDRYGWRLDSTSTSDGVRVFGMVEFIDCYREYVQKHVQDPESRANVENGGIMRFQHMIDSNAVLFDTNVAPDYAAMLENPTVIELDALDGAELKATVTALLLINLKLLIRKRRNFDGQTRHVMFVDEAHVLLDSEESSMEGAANPGKANKRLLQSMVNEMRACGLGLFFGDQHASKLAGDIAGGVGMKLMMLSDDPDDLQVLQTVGHLTPSGAEALGSLKPGEGYFHISGMHEPILVETPNAEKELCITKDVQDEEVHSYMKGSLARPFGYCSDCAGCAGGCELQVRYEADHMASVICSSPEVQKLMKPGDAEAQRKMPPYIACQLPEMCRRVACERYGSQNGDRVNALLTDRMLHCVRIHLARKLLLEGNCMLRQDELYNGLCGKPAGGVK